MYHDEPPAGKIQQTRISTQCSSLSEKIEVLLKLTEELETRLNCILAPDKSRNLKDEPGPMKDTEQPSEHAIFLRERNEQLDMIRDRIGSIIDRVDL